MRLSSQPGAFALAALASLSGIAKAHSWVEQLLVVGSNGTFTGDPGYIRGYVQRTVPGFNDASDLNLIPPNGRQNQSLILPTDPMCNPSQTKQVQSGGNPRLQAAAGASLALQYQENGHVTLPNNQPGKPANRGTVYIYGTDQPMTNEYLLTVHRNWTADGTGGDKRGRLLSTQNFDDGQCYQVNGDKISVARQAEFKFTPTQPMGSNLWCQNDIFLPSDATAGKPYTLYWVWDWPTDAGADASLPQGKEEIYTSCMDIDIIVEGSSSLQKEKSSYVSGQAINNAAVPSYIAAIASGSNVLVTSPTGTTGTALSQTTAPVSTLSASTYAAVPVSITTQPSPVIASSAQMTVYPMTTLMTTVMVSPQTPTGNVPSAPPAIMSFSTAVTSSMAPATVTVTPTIFVTMQPSANPTSLTAVTSSSPIASAGSLATTLSAPSSASSPGIAGRNCTSSTVQKRSNVLGNSAKFRGILVHRY
ncbi:hypothetical protein MMC13_007883 [Lambiella insularis]|nr:hypothetical protein [Lambiella insularis]